MTVQELMARLRRFDPGMEVVGFWDGAYAKIEGVTMDEDDEVVILDVGNYQSAEFYSRGEEGPDEPETEIVE